MDIVSFRIGLKVEELRESKSISQVDLAKKIGISRASMINIEAGRQGVIMRRLYDIALALNVSVAELLPALIGIKSNQGKKT